MANLEILIPKQVGFLSPLVQIILVSLLFVVTIVWQYKEYRQTGKTWGGYYPLHTSSFFAAIYEEVIFRGFIFAWLLNVYSLFGAIVISSLLFGLWHLKNIFYMEKKALIYQMLYTGFVFGPIASLITFYTGTIWLAVIFHFCNNLLAVSSLNFIAKKQR
ncbi:MAG TPA: CPBP family intramembrane glutamic endopeptidase [Candidatus Paceibacterota bacterium]